jgi:hypothetical protein
LQPKVLFDLVQRSQNENRPARHLADLDLVHVVVAAQQQQPDLGLDDCRVVLLIGGQHQRLDGGCSGTPSSAATSSQVLLPGVASFP